MREFTFLLIIVYSLSIIFYLIGLFKNRKRYTQLAYKTIVIGGFFHTITFLFEMRTKQYIPILTIDQILFFYPLLIILLTIIIHHYFQFELLEFSTVSISIGLMMTRMNIAEMEPAIQSIFLSRFLFIHVVFTLLSYVFFAISAIFSGMYIVHNYLLKNKVWNLMIQKLPSLEKLDKNMYLLNLMGLPLLFLGLLIGSIWAGAFFHWNFFVDIKVILSFVVLVMYGFLFIQKKRGKWVKKQLAVFNLFTFLMILINFFLSYHLWSFHQWF